jgi:hypothetical protein
LQQGASGPPSRWLVRADKPQLSAAPVMFSASLAALTTSDGIA